jgi:hypothetical protein
VRTVILFPGVWPFAKAGAGPLRVVEPGQGTDRLRRRSSEPSHEAKPRGGVRTGGVRSGDRAGPSAGFESPGPVG